MRPHHAPISLALSGGGIRAMIFHLGVLRQLAEFSLLERVEKISTVSGGSLITGLIFSESGMRWPSSLEFKDTIYVSLRSKLCSRSLQWGAARQLLRPRNVRFLLARANLLATALREEWGVRASLSDVPTRPEWSINGTTAETGRRFRFKRESLGEYSLGYAEPGNYGLASAMAVSAAFPGGFGPLRLRTADFDWKRRGWGDPVTAAKPTSLNWPWLHLYDGGVYDNLGLEPFFDAGRCAPKGAGSVIVCSDAGAPLEDGFSASSTNPLRLKRVADIMSEQSRALRVRAFHHYICQEPHRAAYIYIAERNSSIAEDDRVFVSTYPTTLLRASENDFNRIADYAASLAAPKLEAL